MAWCYYCRRYTVNGRCPDCGRLYQDPNKNYDFYRKESKVRHLQKATVLKSQLVLALWVAFG